MELGPDGHTLVKNFMMTKPCSILSPQCPCTKHGKWSKNFPKKFIDRISFDQDGFPLYQRRYTSIEVKRSGTSLDNKYVVPYKWNLNVKFLRPMKSLFNNVNKVSDRAKTIKSTNTIVANDVMNKY